MGRRLDTRYKEAVSIYEKGLSVGDCADFFGITRQAMHKILKLRGCKFRRQIKFGDENHFSRYNNISLHTKKRAQHLVEKAGKKNLLIQKPCEVCGNNERFKDGRTGVQAHHDDYDRPLEIRWLCQKCHYEWHSKNTPKGGKEASAENIDIVCGGFP